MHEKLHKTVIRACGLLILDMQGQRGVEQGSFHVREPGQNSLYRARANVGLSICILALVLTTGQNHQSSRASVDPRPSSARYMYWTGDLTGVQTHGPVFSGMRRGRAFLYKKGQIALVMQVLIASPNSIHSLQSPRYTFVTRS